MFPIIDKRETGINIRKIMDCQDLRQNKEKHYLRIFDILPII